MMAPAIVTVTPNPAWDVTYEVPVLVPGELHRVARVRRRLGGKGVNTARVLTALGHRAIAVIPGPRDLDHDGRLALDVVPGLPALRQTLVVHAADGTTTSLWEPGHEAAPDTGDRLLARVLARLSSVPCPRGPQAGMTPRGGGLVVAGSLPPGLDPGLPAGLAAAAIDRGAAAVVDTSGPALARAAEVSGVVLAPNAAELSGLAGVSCAEPATAIAAAREVLEAGPRAVVVTLGEEGLAAVTRDGTWHGRLPEPLSGNPTGAGDAAVAALIAGLTAACPWPELVRDAVAASAAAVLSPVAGDVDPADCARLRRQARIREVT